jgi:cysteine sulfinate desulfinase/cysteine desulfurase-like protein
MGVSRALAQSSLRIGLSFETTSEEVFDLCGAIKRVVKRLRSLR